MNASLGPDTPRDFDPGLYKQTDTNFNADLSWTVSDTLNIGFGGEFRNEEFEIGPGQVESYTAGPLADQGFSTSSNGFPGFLAARLAPSSGKLRVYVDARVDTTRQPGHTGCRGFEDFDGSVAPPTSRWVPTGRSRTTLACAPPIARASGTTPGSQCV
ncbi:MAG: hypothetical protein CM15mP74_23660 [Halieaceae bacterium]|nr:MAG: hypothetical protein CM15mP74_23660 [Halieaceae bacterium]